MNLDEPSKLQTAFGKYAKNPSPSKQLPNFLDLGFGSSDVHLSLFSHSIDPPRIGSATPHSRSLLRTLLQK